MALSVPRTKDFLADFSMGGISAFVSKMVTAPIERVKLILQNQAAITGMAEERQYKGMKDCFRRISKEEGFTSFWRGNFANLMRYFPQQALAFAFKEKYKKLMDSLIGKADPKKEFSKFFFSNVMSGGLAGSTSLLFVYPLDFAWTRLGTDLGGTKAARKFKGIFDFLQKVALHEGVEGLYRGFLISALAYFIYRALYFGIYDSSKAFTGDHPNVLVKFVIAQIGTTISSTAIYPIDTLRRRLMMQACKDCSDVQYCGVRAAARSIYKTEGISGFFKGATANIFRGVGASLVLVLYDELKRFYQPKAPYTSTDY